MKKKLMQVKSFITFDFPLDNRYISTLFTSLHQQYQASFPHWSLNATRKKIIARYWFWFVLIHFSALLGLAIVVTLPFNISFNQFYLPAIFIAGCFSFAILLLTQYGPLFLSDFLPKLENITDEFKNKQNEQIRHEMQKKLQEQFAGEYEKLAKQREELGKEQERLELLQKELLKCRKAQLHTFSLVLIFYVFDKIYGLDYVQCNDKSAAMLTKLFGKDQGGIKDGLQLIVGKKQVLSPRNKTEIQNRFNDVYAFFEELQLPEAIDLLKKIEIKFQ